MKLLTYSTDGGENNSEDGAIRSSNVPSQSTGKKPGTPSVNSSGDEPEASVARIEAATSTQRSSATPKPDQAAGIASDLQIIREVLTVEEAGNVLARIKTRYEAKAWKVFCEAYMGSTRRANNCIEGARNIAELRTAKDAAESSGSIGLDFEVALPKTEAEVRPFSRLKTREDKWAALCLANRWATELNQPLTPRFIREAVNTIASGKFEADMELREFHTAMIEGLEHAQRRGYWDLVEATVDSLRYRIEMSSAANPFSSGNSLPNQ